MSKDSDDLYGTGFVRDGYRGTAHQDPGNLRVYVHPVDRANARLKKALETYMKLRKETGGHSSPEGIELASAYENLQLVRGIEGARG